MSCPISDCPCAHHWDNADELRAKLEKAVADRATSIRVGAASVRVGVEELTKALMQRDRLREALREMLDAHQKLRPDATIEDDDRRVIAWSEGQRAWEETGP